MANAEDIERDVESAVRLFLSESSREHAHNLLTLVHQIGDHAALQVKALGLAIASLRPLFPPPDANHGDAE